MKAYHNEGFGWGFFWVVMLMLVLPLAGLMTIDDTWERLVKKYTDPWKSDCWETAKHERVCRNNNQCKWFRNFCHEE